VMQSVAGCCRVLQRAAGCCRVMQSVAGCCSVSVRDCPTVGLFNRSLFTYLSVSFVGLFSSHIYGSLLQVSFHIFRSDLHVSCHMSR